MASLGVQVAARSRGNRVVVAVAAITAAAAVERTKEGAHAGLPSLSTVVGVCALGDGRDMG